MQRKFRTLSSLLCAAAVIMGSAGFSNAAVAAGPKQRESYPDGTNGIIFISPDTETDTAEDGDWDAVPPDMGARAVGALDEGAQDEGEMGSGEGFAAGESTAPSPNTSVILTCSEVPLYLDEEYLGSGFLIGDVTYVPLLNFVEFLIQSRCEVEWDPESGTAEITGNGIVITLSTQRDFILANGRCLYMEDKVYNINGTMLLPVRTMADVFHLYVDWDPVRWAVLIDDSDAHILAPDTYFYDDDDLYWLSRVINSEAGNQPLDGMIGVGNVVLNRVASSAFANSVYGVIFQEGQFDVVRFGTIYAEPGEQAIAAAKLCLEGYNTVGNSLYFVNPQIGSARFFRENYRLVIAIGEHEFYA